MFFCLFVCLLFLKLLNFVGVIDGLHESTKDWSNYRHQPYRCTDFSIFKNQDTFIRHAQAYLFSPKFRRTYEFSDI